MHEILFADQLGELGRLSGSMKKLEKEIKNSNKYDVCCLSMLVVFEFFIVSVFGFLRDCDFLTLWMQNEQYQAKLKKSNERTLALIKAGIDVVVAAGLLQLAPQKITPRVTGAFGFASSLISCYQVLVTC